MENSQPALASIYYQQNTKLRSQKGDMEALLLRQDKRGLKEGGKLKNTQSWPGYMNFSEKARAEISIVNVGFLPN